MAHQEQRCLRRELGLDDGGDICKNLGGWACETVLRRLLHGAAPAALVEGVDLYRAGGKFFEEGPVGGVAVVTEAMDKD